MGKLNEDIARQVAAAGVRRAVETGTLNGESAIKLAGIFERVDTYELSRLLALKSWWNLRGYRNVHLHVGDSRKLLKPSTEPTLYWLDAHWSAGPTAGRTRECPLLDELTITSPGTFGDWYLIDDARMFVNPPPPPHDPSQWPTITQIRDLIAQLRPDCETVVRDDLDLILVRPAGADLA
jgi:hypothetical protein